MWEGRVGGGAFDVESVRMRIMVDQCNHYRNHSSSDLITASGTELIITATIHNAHHAMLLFFCFFDVCRPSTKTLVTTAQWRTASSFHRLRPAKRPKTAKTALSSSRIAAWWRQPSCTATWGGRTLSLRWWPQTTMVEDTAAKRK